MLDRFPVGSVVSITVEIDHELKEFFTYANVTITGADAIGFAFYDPETDREHGYTWTERPMFERQYGDS